MFSWIWLHQSSRDTQTVCIRTRALAHLFCISYRLPEDASLFDRDYWTERRRYQALCRGDRAAIKLTPRKEAKLKCKLFHGNKARLFLSPGKRQSQFCLPNVRPIIFIFLLQCCDLPLNKATFLFRDSKKILPNSTIHHFSMYGLK